MGGTLTVPGWTANKRAFSGAPAGEFQRDEQLKNRCKTAVFKALEVSNEVNENPHLQRSQPGPCSRAESWALSPHEEVAIQAINAEELSAL
jgi:hypothetical protein